MKDRFQKLAEAIHEIINDDTSSSQTQLKKIKAAVDGGDLEEFLVLFAGDKELGRIQVVENTQ